MLRGGLTSSERKNLGSLEGGFQDDLDAADGILLSEDDAYFRLLI